MSERMDDYLFGVPGARTDIINPYDYVFTRKVDSVIQTEGHTEMYHKWQCTCIWEEAHKLHIFCYEMLISCLATLKQKFIRSDITVLPKDIFARRNNCSVDCLKCLHVLERNLK